MTTKFNSNKMINGTFGRLWLDDEELAQVKTFEAKINIEYEDVDIAGDLGKHKKMTGWTGEGTFVLHKVDSVIAKKLQQAVRDGVLPEIKLIAKLSDPENKGEERVELTGVTINEIMALKFEQKTVREEEVPFNFSSYRFIDMI